MTLDENKSRGIVTKLEALVELMSSQFRKRSVLKFAGRTIACVKLREIIVACNKRIYFAKQPESKLYEKLSK